MPEASAVAPVCRICQCSDLDACEGGCTWVERDLCDTCALLRSELADVIAPYLEVSGTAAMRETRVAVLQGDYPQHTPGHGARAPYTREQAAEFLARPIKLALDEVLLVILGEANRMEAERSRLVVPGRFD